MRNRYCLYSMRYVGMVCFNACAFTSGFFVVEVKLLFAGYGLAVAGGGVEGPLLNGGDDGFVDAVAETAGHFDVGDFAGCVDDDVENDITLRAVRKSGQIGLGRGEVTGKGDVDISFAERVGAGGGVGIG